jgi:hypothetical protein
VPAQLSGPLASPRAVWSEKGFQVGDCTSERIVGANPRPPVFAGLLRPPTDIPRSQVERLEKSARFRVSGRDDPNTETPEFGYIHEASAAERTGCAATVLLPRRLSARTSVSLVAPGSESTARRQPDDVAFERSILEVPAIRNDLLDVRWEREVGGPRAELCRR